MMIVLITNRNNPKVKKVTGNVKSTKIGFTKKLSNAKTTATFKEVSIPLSNRTPFIRWDIIITKAVVINSLRSSFIAKAYLSYNSMLFKVIEQDFNKKHGPSIFLPNDEQIYGIDFQQCKKPETI